MVHSLSLFPAGRADIDELLALVQAYYLHDQIAFDPLRIRPALLALLASDDLGQAFLFKVGNAVIGYGILTWAYDHEVGGSCAVLTDFYLAHGSRGKGFGQQALARIESACASRGIRALELLVSSSNLPAIRLYRKSGFASFDRIPMVKMLAPPT